MVQKTEYRADIDGLRAVAVLSVVFYHFGATWLPGGFVGVDVFFVISGYLITSILWKDITTGQFSLIRFYDRRFRRIVPALTATIVGTLLFAYFVLSLPAYENLGRQGLWSAIGAGNFYFLWNTGYFDPGAELMPLLHTWSLAVEEQFYLFWPLIMAVIAAVWMSSRLALLTLGLIMATSFFAAVWTVDRQPSVAFFMLHTRAWELALGAALVFLPALKNRILAEVTSAAGVVLIVTSVLILTSESPFPGLNALAPCVGAALLILPKSATWTSRVLSTEPLRRVGLASYSLYLVHWPVLVFWRVANDGAMPGSVEFVGLLVGSLSLAFLSLHVIERPFRRGANKPSLTILAALSVTVVTGLVATISPIILRDQTRSEVFRIAEFLDYRETEQDSIQFSRGVCFITGSENVLQVLNKDQCLELDNSRPNYLLIGDSHMAHLVAALRQTHPHINFLEFTASGCRPVILETPENNCERGMNWALTEYVASNHIDGVVLSGRWKSNEETAAIATVRELQASVEDVIVFGPTVEYEAPFPTLLAADMLGTESISKKLRLSRQKKIDDAFNLALSHANLKYVSVYSLACPDGECITMTNGSPLQFDYGHFTLDGSLEIVARMGCPFQICQD